MNLKEQLAAKKAAEATKNEGSLPKVEAPAESATVEEKQPEPDYKGPQFRKGSFAYQFKYSKGVIKCDKMGVYTPKNAVEFEILKHAVKAGNIFFN